MGFGGRLAINATRSPDHDRSKGAFQLESALFMLNLSAMMAIALSSHYFGLALVTSQSATALKAGNESDALSIFLVGKYPAGRLGISSPASAIK
jgi:hypothetical protein